MDRLREFLQRSPWAGWLFAGLILAASMVVYLSRTTSDDPYNADRMREMVTIKFTDTGDVIEMPRGRLDKELRGRGDTLDPTKGIINPKTGEPTGFLYNKREWETMIERINAEKKEIREETRGKAVPPAPRPQPAPGSIPGEAAPSPNPK